MLRADLDARKSDGDVEYASKTRLAYNFKDNSGGYVQDGSLSISTKFGEIGTVHRRVATCNATTGRSRRKNMPLGRARSRFKRQPTVSY